MVSHLTFRLRNQTGILSLLLRDDSLFLSYQCIMALYFRTLAHLLSYSFLLNSFFALFVRDFLLLIGYFLHLLADATDNCRTLFLQLEFCDLSFQVVGTLMLNVPSRQASHRCSQQSQTCYSCRYILFFHSLFRASIVMSSLCSASPTKAATSALTVSIVC